MKNSENMTREIISLEKKYWTAMRDKDLKIALQLTHFPCLIAGAQGAHSVDKKKFEKMFKSTKETIRTFDFEKDHIQVQQVSPDTVVVAYKVRSTFLKNGEDKTIDAIDTSTWIKQGKKWVCAMHTETELDQI